MVFCGAITFGEFSLAVVLFDTTRVDELCRELEALGCETECYRTHKLVAVNVPRSVVLGSVQAYLRAQATQGWLDYEEPLLRQ